VLEEYRRFGAIVEALLRGQPSDTLNALAETRREVLSVIQHEGSLWADRREDVLAEALRALDTEVGLRDRLYGEEEAPAFVPDTNALLYNARLENWQFEGVSTFTLVLVPTVVSEVDRLKVEHRNDAVRDRADQLIRRLKEYRRRGLLTAGVPLVNGRSYLLAIAVEP